jgi:hypothetical protein
VAVAVVVVVVVVVGVALVVEKISSISSSDNSNTECHVSEKRSFRRMSQWIQYSYAINLPC